MAGCALCSEGFPKQWLGDNKQELRVPIHLGLNSGYLTSLSLSFSLVNWDNNCCAVMRVRTKVKPSGHSPATLPVIVR